jgi:hypothetical protein
MPATTPRPPSSEQVAAFVGTGGRLRRNRWPPSIGTRGRVQSESPAAIVGIRRRLVIDGLASVQRGTTLADDRQLRVKWIEITDLGHDAISAAVNGR